MFPLISLAGGVDGIPSKVQHLELLDIIYGSIGQIDDRVRNTTHQPLFISEESLVLTHDLFILFSNMIAENLLNTCCLFQRRTNYV